jgi:hypothetical protein
MKNTKNRWLFILPALYWAPGAFADYKDNIGYTALQSLLGSNTPTGANVNVTQAEASAVGVTDPAYPIYSPDTSKSQFAFKNFSFPGAPSTSPYSHATGVGSLFYGNDAIAYGIDNITSYETNGWLRSIATASTFAPVNGSRIANHSWVGNGNTPAETGLILRLVDRQVQNNQFIQVVGMANNASNSPLLGSAYNVIAVGRTDGGQDHGSKAVDTVYVAGRTRPDLVAPETTTSAAAPIVSAAAALLVETGHNGALTLSKDSTDIAGVGKVYNAERADTVKAALMAGADRVTANGFGAANITDYRSNGHQTANGLDDRFGAGQVNILHSYQIIAAGEQNSLEDGGANQGAIDSHGFDYDPSFGGSYGSNTTATYKFKADTNLSLSASLAWNLGVSNDASLSTTLHHLNLELYDLTAQSTSAFSASSIDNTENIWVNLKTGHSYELLVKPGESGNFSWDYSLAWRMSPIITAPVPVPGAFYLFASALAWLGFAVRRKTKALPQ